MTVKSGAEHLKQDVHMAEASHHNAMAKSKRNRATIFRAMHKEAGLSADAQSSHSKMADALDHEADLHEAHAGHHQTAAEKCEKAAADALNKLQPMQVSAPAQDRPTIKPVLRTGAPPLQQPARSDPCLAKILGTRDEDQYSEEPSLFQ